MDESFTSFKDIKKLLEEHKFFGDIVTINRKDRVKATYTFRSITWYYITYKISTIKIDNDRIVIGTTINDENLESFEDFKSSLNDINRIFHGIKRERLNQNKI